MLTSVLRTKIDSLWDKFWSGGIANPLTAMEQISYLLFMRRLDAMDQTNIEDAEFTGEKHTSIFKGHKTCRWSEFRHYPAQEMLKHVREEVFPFIQNLGDDDQPFARHMSDAVFIIPKPTLLVEAIGIIEDIYTELERERKDEGQTFHDTQGDVYEYLLGEISAAGKNGQFRTPRHIIQMMCSLIDPKLGEEICDPACGTGGFLLGAFQHILTNHTSKKLRWVDENGFEKGLIGDKLTDQRQWEGLRERTFYGYDFDTTMVRIGLMNLITHGIHQPNIDYKDTLSKKYTESDRYDVVLANPPFKGSIDKGDINEDLSLDTKKTELLFVNRIINVLRVGGRAAVIVPDGVLFGSSQAHQELRKMLIEECELQGVVSMPSGVFKPYAGVSTAVVIFVKGGSTENVWFYDMEADGRSLDDKRGKIEDNDIPDILTRWKERDASKDTDRKVKAFCVPAEEIRKNKYDLSINRYKEIVYEEVKYGAPKVILKRLKALENEIRTDIDELERMLS
jgi:type I restriction enzyme M protein